MASRFFVRLGKVLAERGHRVYRINFNGGDRLFWNRRGAVDYRGSLDEWPAFLGPKLREWGVTDIILFGDCRPLHLAAIGVAGTLNIPCHVFEEGYFRPSWIALETGGVNRNSSLPRDPELVRRRAAELPLWDEGEPVRDSFFRRAVEDVAYNVATVAMAWRYPGYRTHRPWHPFVEYGGWLRRFAAKPVAEARSKRAGALLANQPEKFYLFPLQLDCDTQVRRHSPFGRLEPAIETVLTSFARHAPPGSLLVVKEHPLDNGLRSWRKLCRTIALRNGVEDRVIYLERGTIEPFFDRCRGIVTINSTVGLSALLRGLPVIALGTAIYNLPGLTFAGGLDEFWANGGPPDPALCRAFRRVVAETQVNGGFFSERGLALATAGAVVRLERTRAAGDPFVIDQLPAAESIPQQKLRQATVGVNVP